MEIKKGTSIITFKLRLYCENSQWLYETANIYNLVLTFYYDILRKEPDLYDVPKHKLMRQLELLTVGKKGQDKGDVKYLMPYDKVPLYFRRAAINDAIRLFRIYMAGKENGSKPAGSFHTSPIFYKGMYKNFTETGICLKLWNGDRWVWTDCRLDTCKRTMPEKEKCLSPVLKLDGRKAMLHVPVIQEAEDVGTAQERLVNEECICAISFPGNDCLAVLAVMDKSGNFKESLFVRGGNELRHKKKQLLNQIRKNQVCMRGKNAWNQLESEDVNKYLKVKIRNLTDDYVHKTSSTLIEFCRKRNIHILAVPNYKHGINLNEIGYLQAASYDWLGRRIIQYLRYKAFAKGMAVVSVSTKDIARTCYLCHEPVKRFNKNHKPGYNYYGGKNFICPNGHSGNANFNSAMNIGRKFLKSQGEIQG